jgi:predicted lipid-binding transport protein (Tim44 family)
MPFCPKCGNKVDEPMNFCPNCGTQLKSAVPSQAAAPSQGATANEPYPGQEKAEKNEKQVKQAHPEKGEKQGKVEHGFVGSLAGGLILITFGVFAILELTNPSLSSGEYFAIMLLIIGLIVILAAVYVALAGRKYFPPTNS